MTSHSAVKNPAFAGMTSESLVLRTSESPQARQKERLARRWMTSHSAVKNPASAGMTSKSARPQGE